MRDTERREELLVAEIAADWLQRLKDGGPDVHAAFGHWLRESPRHIREILLATAYQHALRHMKDHRRVDLDALREQHRLEARLSIPEWPIDAQATSNRQAKSGTASTLTAAWSSLFARVRWKLAAAAICLVIASLTVVAIGIKSDHTISTGPGEWHVARLADGTVLHAGPRTRASVDISDRERVVRLDRGEVMVNVAKDPSRPFFVQTPTVSARAVGTAFAVQRMDPSHVSITVREGVVGVRRNTARNTNAVVVHSSSNEAVVLKAGQKVEVASDAAPLRAQTVDVERELAWVQGKLYLERTVAEAIHEMNLRNRTQIRLSDPALNQRRITGVVDAADPVAFAKMLGLALPVSIVEDEAGTLLLIPEPKDGSDLSQEPAKR